MTSMARVMEPLILTTPCSACVKIASERDYLGKDVVGITIIAILPTCIERKVDLKKLDNEVMEALKANETA